MAGQRAGVPPLHFFSELTNDACHIFIMANITFFEIKTDGNIVLTHKFNETAGEY